MAIALFVEPWSVVEFLKREDSRMGRGEEDIEGRTNDMEDITTNN